MRYSISYGSISFMKMTWCCVLKLREFTTFTDNFIPWNISQNSHFAFDLLEEVLEVGGGGGEDHLVRVIGGATAACQSDIGEIVVAIDLSWQSGNGKKIQVMESESQQSNSDCYTFETFIIYLRIATYLLSALPWSIQWNLILVADSIGTLVSDSSILMIYDLWDLWRSRFNWFSSFSGLARQRLTSRIQILLAS